MLSFDIKPNMFYMYTSNKYNGGSNLAIRKHEAVMWLAYNLELFLVPKLFKKSTKRKDILYSELVEKMTDLLMYNTNLSLCVDNQAVKKQKWFK